MKIKEKIFMILAIIWLAVVYVFYYIGLLNGLSKFHPHIIERIKNIF